MDTQRKARIIAVAGTLLVAVVVFLVLYTNTLTLSANDLAAQKPAEIVLADETFVDVLQPPTSGKLDNNPSNAYSEEELTQDSQASPESGLDMRDDGAAGETPLPTSARQPSPVKQAQAEKSNPTGPSATTSENAARRAANNDVANAFNRAGRNNADNGNEQPSGSAGSTTGSKESTTIGSGTGSIGGGWIMPKYGKVRSNKIGVVNATVRIDRTGKVVSVTFTAGTPPASADATVRAAVEREIRAHRFTHTRPEEAQEATAYITYRFVNP